jgi:hypothetical protein
MAQMYSELIDRFADWGVFPTWAFAYGTANKFDRTRKKQGQKALLQILSETHPHVFPEFPESLLGVAAALGRAVGLYPPKTWTNNTWTNHPVSVEIAVSPSGIAQHW